MGHNFQEDSTVDLHHEVYRSVNSSIGAAFGCMVHDCYIKVKSSLITLIENEVYYSVAGCVNYVYLLRPFIQEYLEQLNE